jgi:hypothetical protein
MYDQYLHIKNKYIKIFRFRFVNENKIKDEEKVKNGLHINVLL